eukprot:13131288-Alexandrium_andersonii.AAC.1
MYSNAPTRLERFGAVSCAPPPAPSPRGLPTHRHPRKSAGGAFVWGRVRGGGSPPGEGAGGGAQETAPNRSKR